MEEETQEEEERIAFMSLLSTIQTKVGEQPNGHVCRNQSWRWETLSHRGYESKHRIHELANEIHLPYKEKGYVKWVNAKSLSIHGVHGADFQIGPWER